MNSQTEIFVEEFETFYVAVWREKEEVGEEGLRGREDRWKEGSEEDVRLRGKEENMGEREGERGGRRNGLMYVLSVVRISCAM